MDPCISAKLLIVSSYKVSSLVDGGVLVGAKFICTSNQLASR